MIILFWITYAYYLILTKLTKIKSSHFYLIEIQNIFIKILPSAYDTNEGDQFRESIYKRKIAQNLPRDLNHIYDHIHVISKLWTIWPSCVWFWAEFSNMSAKRKCLCHFCR